MPKILDRLRRYWSKVIEKINMPMVVPAALGNHWFFRSTMTTTVSIMLAFMIDRCYESYKNRNEVEDVVQTVYQEYKTNIGQLDTAIWALHDFRDSLFLYRKDTLQTLMRITSRPPYLHLIEPSTLAHNFLIEREGLKSDWELMRVVSSIDIEYKSVQSQNRLLETTLYSPSSNSTTIDGKMNKILMFNITGNYIYSLITLRNRLIESSGYFQEKRLIKKEALPPKLHLNADKIEYVNE